MWAARLASVLLLASASLACSRSAPSGRAQGEPALAALAPWQAKPLVLVGGLQPLLEAPPPLARPWTQALRMERWEDAARLMSAEPLSLSADPRVRYARASVASELGDFATTVRLLKGLEAELPLLDAAIRARRAAAALQSGEAALALSYFESRSDPLSRLRAAEAKAKLGERAGARVALEGLLPGLPKKGSRCILEAPARRLLADLTPPDAPALLARDLRWLAVEAPLCPSSEGAALRLQSLPSPWPLTAAERHKRAEAFASAGLIAETESELAVLADVSPPLEAGLALALRGRARFSARRELSVAAELLSAAAALNPARAGALFFDAAKARARDGAIQEALDLYARVRRADPRGALSENAEYQRAQLLYTAGRFEEASKAYDAYVARYGLRGRFTERALDDRAVAWLASGQARQAARAFAELAKASSERDRSRYEQLEGVAWLRAGERERARTRFHQVARNYPLSFAALAAIARLESMGDVVPPPAASAEVVDRSAPLVVQLPAPVALLHELGLDREAELRLAELEATLTRPAPALAARTLCAAYAQLAPAERAYRVGQGAVSSSELSKSPLPERRWLWDCVYPRPYAALVDAQAAEYALDSELIYAVMRQESGFRPQVTSPARAIGLLQILPSTGERLAAELGLPFRSERLGQPPFNVRLGSHYLRKLLDVFQGNVALAAASYNAGPVAVLRWLEGGQSLELDVFVARIPYAETRGYVERVLGNYARYLYLKGGSSAVPRLSLALPAPVTRGVELY